MRPYVLITLLLLSATNSTFVSAQSLEVTPATESVATEVAAQDTRRAAALTAIQQAGANFREAFQSGDAQAVADCWTEEGEFIGGDGQTLRGRAAIAAAYQDFFKEFPKPQASVDVTSVRFVGNQTAVEEGFFKVRRDPTQGWRTNRYSLLYVNEDNTWKMAVVREWPESTSSLQELEWLLGDWLTNLENVKVQTTYEWEIPNVLIRGRFQVEREGQNISGTQLIARDPATNQIRSWTFDANGGIGESVWTADGNQWLIEASGVNGDGTAMTATNILTKLDENTFTWQSTNRTVDGEPSDELPPVRVTRNFTQTKPTVNSSVNPTAPAPTAPTRTAP